MPLTERERKLFYLLDRQISWLKQRVEVDPDTIDPFGPEDVAVQRWLQLAVQCCLDLGDSILSGLGEPEPPRYRDIFPALARRGVIPAELVRSLESLAEFRYVLGHAYASLTPHDTWQRVREGIPVLVRYAEAIGLPEDAQSSM